MTISPLPFSVDRCATSPLRVDFAGGWLDCPRFARADAYIINCAISPFVTLDQLQQSDRIGTGMGASAARWLLLGQDPVAQELASGVGWQDPAVILETGLCVWRSGTMPFLDLKVRPQMLVLDGVMALLWTGPRESSSGNIGNGLRNLDMIHRASLIARDAVRGFDRELLYCAIKLSYQAQLDEGMASLPNHGEQAKKYCGAGFGGMALYCFGDVNERLQFLADVDATNAVEPYFKAS